jgi:gluconolactonase
MKFDEKTNQTSVFRANANYANGNARDRQGRLVTCEHSVTRRITRTEKDGKVTVLADKFEGKRLNAPNDIVVKSDDTIWFTDPIFGINGEWEGKKEKPEQATTNVYRLAKDGKLTAVLTDLVNPNGLAFSPDEKFLYVGNWDEKRAVVYRYPVNADATLGKGELFYDLTTQGSEDAIDGIKVDRAGNVYVSGPAGLWVFSSDGKHLGTLRCPEHPHNMAWGDADRQTLYLTAQTGIYRIRLNVAGAGAWSKTETMAKN